MKSKIWLFRFFGRSDGSGYMQTAGLKFYDDGGVLVDTAGAKAWSYYSYTTASSTNRATAALFDNDSVTWLAQTDNASGNTLKIEFPTEVEIGSFTVTTRSGSLTRGTIEVFKVLSTDEIYDFWVSRDEPVYVNNFQIYSSTTQEDFTFILDDVSTTETFYYVDKRGTCVPEYPGNHSDQFPGFHTFPQVTNYKPSYFGDGFIEGKIIDADSNVIEGAKLQLVDSVKRNYIAETFSDVLGNYRFDNLTRDGTLFDVIADEGTGTFEKKVSSLRFPQNAIEHDLVGSGLKGTLTPPAFLNTFDPLILLSGSKRKGTGGVAILNNPDPFLDKTVLLVDVNSTTISDKSKSALPFTVNTLTIASTNSPPIGTYSIQLSGTQNGYFSNFADMFDRDFTLEYYVCLTSVTASSRLISIGGPAFTGGIYGSIEFSANTSLGNYSNLGNINGYVSPWDTSTNTLVAGAWHHMAWVRQGHVYTLYRDGAQITSQTYTTYPVDLRTDEKTVYIGTPTANLVAQLAGIRLTAAARYTSAFTPPTSSELYG